MKVGEGNDEAELDNFIVQPAPLAGEEEQQQQEEEQANQDRHLDKKNVTRRGLLKVFLFIIESSILFDPSISTSSLTLFFQSSSYGSWRYNVYCIQFIKPVLSQFPI